MAPTPLHDAALAGDLDAIDACIGAGADLDAKDEHGFTALINAVHGGHLDAVRRILAAGADVHLRQGADGDTPLLRAAKYGAFGRGASSEAERTVFVDIADLLIAAGADVQAAADRGTVAEVACELASAALLLRVLDAGASATATALETALESNRGRTDKVRALLAHGAAPTALAMVRGADCRPDGVELIQAMFAAGGDPNAALDSGWTPLHQAVYAFEPETVEVLLRAGADPDRKLTGHYWPEDSKIKKGTTPRALADEEPDLKPLFDREHPASPPPPAPVAQAFAIRGFDDAVAALRTARPDASLNEGTVDHYDNVRAASFEPVGEFPRSGPASALYLQGDGLSDATVGDAASFIDYANFQAVGTWNAAGDGRFLHRPGEFALLRAELLQEQDEDEMDPTDVLFAAWRVTEGWACAVWEPSDATTLAAVMGIGAMPDDGWSPCEVWYGE